MIRGNKWLSGAIPALLIHSCIGSVYCWSLLKGPIASEMGVHTKDIEFAFSLAIFFLGMSAAFGGRFVEKNVKTSCFISTAFFSSGLIMTASAIQLGSIPLLLLGYGAVMGIGLGIGYLSPVKTLILWFKEHPGLATGIAISGFGLSKVLFSPIIETLVPRFGIINTLIIMSIGSIIPMAIATFLIEKPSWWVETRTKFDLRDSLKVIFDSRYIRIWIVFYLNITCGLALISFEKDLALVAGVSSIALFSSITATFNTIGRFGFSTASDYLKNKTLIYSIIFLMSAVVCLGGVSMLPIFLVIALYTINAGYGGGFSTLPIILKSKFGMSDISTIHGFALSAWAWAGLSGNQLSSFLINYQGLDYSALLLVVGILYLMALGITITLNINSTNK